MSLKQRKIKFEPRLKLNHNMYIDQQLHWGPQIKHINNKLAKNIGIVTKLRYYVNLHTITSWGSDCKTRLNRIRTKQNKCIRSIFWAHSRENATSYYNLLDILKFDNIFKLKVARILCT